MKRRWSIWVGGWVCIALFYTWCNGKLEKQQLIAAAIVSLVITFALLRLASLTRLSFSFRRQWFIAFARTVTSQIFRSVRQLLSVLLRGRRCGGVYRERKFDPGADNRYAAGRRAIVYGEISLPPNSYAVCHGQDWLLVHELAPESEPTDPKWPI